MKDYARACKIIIFIIVFMLFTYFTHSLYTAMNQWQNAQYRKIEIMIDSMTERPVSEDEIMLDSISDL